MPTVEVLGLGKIEITTIVLGFLLELAGEEPYSVNDYNLANRRADDLARTFARAPEDKPDPGDDP